MVTWRELITMEMDLNRDHWSNAESIVIARITNRSGYGFDDYDKSERTTIHDEELDRKFDNGFGGAEGAPFTIHTTDYIYFPSEYDGAEGVESINRNPNETAKNHV